MTAFPDLHLEVRGVLADGDRVAQEWTATGTNEGELMGLEPTGRRIEVIGCTVAAFNPDGSVRESQLYWDVAGLMRQLGPAVAATSTRA
jgi:predicted ester cyclase